MSVPKIEGIINGLNLMNSVLVGPDIVFSGYMIRVPSATEEAFTAEQLEDLTSWGWVPSMVKDKEGVIIPGYEGFIFAGDV